MTHQTSHTLSLLLAGLLVLSCSSPEKEKLRHIAKGQEYLKEKRYAEARIEFRSALQIDRRLAEAYFGLGQAALPLGFIQEAAEAYYSAMRLDQNHLEARVRAGNLLAQYSNEESILEAERLANDVLKKNQDYIEGRVLLANVRIAQKKWDEAKQEFDRAMSLDPNRSETKLNLARYYNQRAKAEPAQAEGLISQGEVAFRQVVDKNPNDSGARLAFADFFFVNKRAPEAEHQLLEAVKTNPKDQLVLLALRRFYESQQRFDEAEKYVVELANLDPDKSAGRAQIIDLHARRGRIQEAITEYQQLIKDNPKYLRAYSRLAELQMELGDMSGAMKQVEAALRQNPQDTDALLMRGRLLTLNGQYRDAAVDLDRVLRFEPSMPAALYYAADAHLQNNDPTQARLLVNSLLNFYPRNPMGLLMMVRIMLNEGRPAEAERNASEIIEIISQLKTNPTALHASRIPTDALPEWESKAFISRAVARIQLRDYTGAQTDLENAIRIDQNSPEPHVNLATIHLLRGDLPLAQREAERAVDVALTNVSAVTTLINVYLRQGNYTGAHSRLDQLLNAQPNRVQLMEQKARVYAAQGDGSNAEKTLHRIIELDPNYMNAYFALSDYYQSSQKETESAITKLRELISRKPANIQQIAQAHLLIGLLEEGRGNYDEAVRNYEQTLSFEKRSIGAAIAFNNLAWLFADKGKGNLDKATDHARKAITIMPEASFYDTLGFAYFKKRQFDIAIEQFNKAIDRRPTNPNFHVHLARAFRENGNTEKARQAYERALQLGGPGFTKANEVRQELNALRRS